MSPSPELPMPPSSPRKLAALSFAAVTGIGVVALLAVFELIADRGRAAAVAKLIVAAAAAAAVLVEKRRGKATPEAQRRAVGLALGALAILAHAGEFEPGPKFVHLWDQFHYYMGAKYFPEVGYANVYRCALVAESEIGTIETVSVGSGAARAIDVAAEARDAGRKIRDIEGTNLLSRVRDLGVLDHPERCKGRFSPERWEAYKADIRFFRVTAGQAVWQDILEDHGFNPPPVWMIAGRLLAGTERVSLAQLQMLALLDVVYLIGVFVALWWAFGWRVTAAGAIVWGCQGAATFLWTAGAYLRQDWLFFSVLAMCLLRRRFFALAGASLAYAALLRVFPGLIAIGWAAAAAGYAWKHRRLARSHVRVLAGAVTASVVLIAASVAVCGPRAYEDFAHRTLGVHNKTWTSNLMGTSIVVAHGVGLASGAGRLEDALDTTRTDASEAWRVSRAERFEKVRFVAWALGAMGLLFFASVVRRVRSLWLAGCLGQLGIVLASQIACYYYSFLILGAPLTRARRSLELPLFLFACATQVATLLLPWPDDRYALLSFLSSALCVGLVAAFDRRAPVPAAGRLGGYVLTNAR